MAKKGKRKSLFGGRILTRPAPRGEGIYQRRIDGGRKADDGGGDWSN